ncbi:hypothetical protein D910_00631, partial [Dendroctonus ponderosae]
MMLEIRQKIAFLYPTYVLAIVSIGYVLGELGHYMIGVTSKAIAMDLHYGDITCQLNNTELYLSDLPVVCSDANNSDTCLSLSIDDEPYCEWTYNGLGLDYQILAGPSFIAVFTVVGVIMEEKRALVMSIFNWGIYGGYGIAFPVGRYIPPLNAWGLGWRVCYYGAGIVALIFAFLTIFTLKEPERQSIGEDAAAQANPDAKKVTI